MSAARYTARGGDEVEARIGALVGRVRDAIRVALDPRAYRAVLLIGGYGRGEGGVATTNGREVPHNNLDLLVITRGRRGLDRLKARIDAALDPIAREEGVGLDSGCVAESVLRRAPPHVMWHDAYFGHRVLLGDPGLMRSLRHLGEGRIPSVDVRDLLVNRGTLLVLNDALFERPSLEADARRAIVRHGAKAIIGYGDALLYTRGAYHWSYVEKQRRMRAQGDVPESFRRLYDDAMEFRFRPAYERFVESDLGGWVSATKAALEPVHLAFEAARLGRPGLTWDEHAALAFRRTAAEGWDHFRTAARKASLLPRSGPAPRALSPLARLGFRCATMRDRISVAFPSVAYPWGSSAMGDSTRSDVLRAILGAAGTGPPEVRRRAYLRLWGAYGDPNFAQVARAHGIDLQPS
jgi:hypothetical protein